jgi:hypothetical protein
MDTHSVENDSPPGQVAPLGTWSAWGGNITLEPTADREAIMWFTPHGAGHDNGEPFGNVKPDPDSDQMIVAWNSAGRMTLGRHEVEKIDRQILLLMAQTR